MPQKEIVTIVQRYIAVLKAAGIPIQKVFLYGSCARGENSKQSDIDVLLISDVFDTNDDYVTARPWLYTVNVDYRLEPYVVGMKRFMSDTTSPLLEIIRREGVEIAV